MADRKPIEKLYGLTIPINGKRNSTYTAWANMKARCGNPNRPDYKFYGGRGITVCDRWRQSFSAFLDDVGECPPGYSLDRIDNERGYEPGNVRWATRTQQMRNSRRTRLTEADVKRIHKLRSQGWTLEAIGLDYGMTKNGIWSIVTGEVWQ
ncbi:MAG: hypothetical protein J2P48_08265 [Alphaproteobacteria bacterium]|nr:hypothetical protein [Alphaproteobacteria bacterium]